MLPVGGGRGGGDKDGQRGSGRGQDHLAGTTAMTVRGISEGVTGVAG